MRGKVSSPNMDEALGAMSGFYTYKVLNISTEVAPNIVGGYLDLSVKYPRLICIEVRNLSDTAAKTAILKTRYGDEATFSIPVEGSTGLLPEITHIKQAGTSDGILLMMQKV